MSELISQGTYGCAYYPVLPCDPKSSSPKSSLKKEKIGKIFKNHRDFEYEKKIIEMLKQIDPKNKWTVKYFGSCYIDTSANMSEINKCNDINDTTNLEQILLQHGGIDLFEFVNSSKQQTNFDELISLFLPIFKGINDLNNSGYYHLDIKPSNILYDDTSNKLYLIDFGLVTKHDDMYIDSIFKSLYRYFPPEFLIFNKLIEYKKRTDDVDKLRTDLKNDIEKLKEVFSNTFKIQKNRSSNITKLIRILTDGYKKLDEFLEIYIKLYQESSDSIILIEKLNEYKSKADVYGLGITLLEIYFLLHSTNQFKCNNEKVVDECILLFKKMINANPNERLNSKEAYDKLYQILMKFKYVEPSKGGRRNKVDNFEKTGKHYRNTKKCIYVKGKGKTEYLRINKEYITVKQYEKNNIRI